MRNCLASTDPLKLSCWFARESAEATGSHMQACRMIHQTCRSRHAFLFVTSRKKIIKMCRSSTNAESRKGRRCQGTNPERRGVNSLRLLVSRDSFLQGPTPTPSVSINTVASNSVLQTSCCLLRTCFTPLECHVSLSLGINEA